MMKLECRLIAVVSTKRATSSGLINQPLLRSPSPLSNGLHAATATPDATRVLDHERSVAVCLALARESSLAHPLGSVDVCASHLDGPWEVVASDPVPHSRLTDP
jgi:hypothetical protein